MFPGKALLITLGFPPAVGGIQSLLWRRALLGGERMVVIAPETQAGQPVSWHSHAGYQVPQTLRWRTPLDRTPGLRRVSQMVAPLGLAWTVCAAGQTGCIECGQALPFGLTALVLQRRFGLPYAVWSYGDDLLKPLGSILWRPWLRLVLQRANAVYACSRWTASVAVQAGAQPSAVQVVYPWAAAHYFEASAPPAQHNSLRLLTVARLEARKGIDLVLRALPQVLAHIPTVQYEIVGQGPRLAALQALACALGVAHAVQFSGAVPESQLPLHHVCSDLFVMTSTPNLAAGENEGFGLVYAEAAACHRPSIALRRGGVPEAVIDGETGLLADQANPAEIADLILRLARRPELRRRYGDSAYALAVQRAEQAARRFGMPG